MRLFQRLRSKEAEFNRHATVQDVVAAYRLLLQRNPDPGGLDTYRRLVAKGLTLDRLCSIFLNSDEFKNAGAQESQVTTVDLGGYFVCCRQSEPDFGRSIVETREYEPHVRRAIAETLREGQTFVDIGANVGCISLLAAKIVGPGGLVVAVEPNPDNLQLLYAGIALNGVANVRVLPFAASDTRSVFSLAGGASNTHLVTARHHGEPGYYAQSVVLDEELTGLAAIDFVKVDIEGYEPIALRGFSSLLRKHRPVLLTEFNPRCLRDIQRAEPAEYLDQLLSFYTRLQVISPFGDSAAFTSAGEVMRYWSQRNSEIVVQGLLPDGMLHFDVIATNR